MFFGKKSQIEPIMETVDSIVSDLKAKIESLRNLATSKEIEVEIIQDNIAHMLEEQRIATGEAQRANIIAEKIESLIS